MEKDPSIQETEIVHVSELFKADGGEVGRSCMCTAEDLVQAANYNEIEKLAPKDIANSILSIMLDYESKLNHFFTSRKSQILMKERKKSTSDREKKQTEIYQLKPIPQGNFVPTSFSLDSDFLEFLDFNINTKPCSIMNYKLVHPLQSITDFNGSISVIAHIVYSTQKAFSIKHKCIIIPIPSASLVQINGTKKRLWFSQSNPQTEELQELSDALKLFVTYVDDICEKSSKVLSLESPPKSEITIDQLVTSGSVKVIGDSWQTAAVSLLVKAKFCAQCIQNFDKA